MCGGPWAAAGRCTRSALVSKLKEQAAGGGTRHNLSPSSAPVLEIEVKVRRCSFTPG